MNLSLQQLEYIVAVDTWRHFHKAAERCFVTQPTLSMQIQKLEDDIGIKIFDRSKKPIVPTEFGAIFIAQARKIIGESHHLRELISEFKGSHEGELRLGIIPTIAPYLLPFFLKSFLEKYPEINLQISETKTETLLKRLRRNELDAGILSTPLNESDFSTEVLYNEEFLAYVAPSERLYHQKLLSAADIASSNVWLLEDGHCFRDQMLNFCAMASPNTLSSQLRYQAGSLETLKRMVDLHEGITFLPKLATFGLSKLQTEKLRTFAPPVPIREISLVTYSNTAKRRLINLLKEELLESIPEDLQVKKFIKLPHNQ